MIGFMIELILLMIYDRNLRGGGGGGVLGLITSPALSVKK